jgi:hypothetical protein
MRFQKFDNIFLIKIMSNYALKQPLIKSIMIFIHYSVGDVWFFTNNLWIIVSRVNDQCCELLAFWNRWVRVGYMYAN